MQSTISQIHHRYNDIHIESIKNFRFQNTNETEERSRGREQRIEAGKGIGNRGEE
jgi:hypothetical protein